MKSQLHHTAGMRGHIFSTYLHATGKFCKVKKKFDTVSVESTFLSFSMTPSSNVEGHLKETGFMGDTQLCGLVAVRSQLVRLLTGLRVAGKGRCLLPNVGLADSIKKISKGSL